jgi:hypothetical protein
MEVVGAMAQAKFELPKPTPISAGQAQALQAKHMMFKQITKIQSNSRHDATQWHNNNEDRMAALG